MTPALKQMCIDAMELAMEYTDNYAVHQKAYAALAALRAEPDVQPVAWLTKIGDAVCLEYHQSQQYESTPLYLAAPQSAEPVSESVAWRQWLDPNEKLNGYWMYASTEKDRNKCSPQLKWEPLYAAPQSAVPLTEVQIFKALDSSIDDVANAKHDPESWETIVNMVRAIEAAHGIKEKT